MLEYQRITYDLSNDMLAENFADITNGLNLESFDYGYAYDDETIFVLQDSNSRSPFGQFEAYAQGYSQTFETLLAAEKWLAMNSADQVSAQKNAMIKVWLQLSTSRLKPIHHNVNNSIDIETNGQRYRLTIETL